MIKRISFILILCSLFISACSQKTIEDPDVNQVINQNSPAVKISYEDESNTADTEIIKEYNNLPFESLLQKIIKEENYSNYTDIKIHKIKENIYLIGFGKDHFYAYNRHYFIVNTEDKSYKKIEGDFSKIYAIEDDIILAYNDGDLSKTSCFAHNFPYLSSYNLTTGECKKELFYANMSDWEIFQIGGTGKDYTLVDVSKEESSYILHLKSSNPVMGSPHGTIRSTNDKIIINLFDVNLSNSLTQNLSNIVYSESLIENIENSFISISTKDVNQYNCEISNIEDGYYTFTIAIK